MIDLHTHSSVSDGSLSPAALAEHAAAQAVSVLALTDHDSTDGNDEAARACAGYGIRFVPGVELNIDWPTGECHLLGLNVCRPGGLLKTVLADLRAGRDERNEIMMDKMRAAGYSVSAAEIRQMFRTECLGRPHFAEYMVKKNIVKSRQQAFDLYLGKGRPFYTDRKGAGLDTAVEAVRLSGGIPVLAHPLSLYVSWGKLENVLREFFRRGVMGIEAWHPAARAAECVRLEKLAGEIGFIVTAGSDFHGAVRADREIGRACGKKIEDRFWTDELLPLIERESTPET